MHIENANELIGRAVEIVINHDVVVAVGKGKLMGGVCHTQLDRLGRSVPRPTRRSRSTSSEGGLIKISTASGKRSLTCKAPWTSISKIRDEPEASLDVTSLTKVP